ncbi:MAG: cobaltochelatase CobT-related protein [Acidimicrobiales bacterium]
MTDRAAARRRERRGAAVLRAVGQEPRAEYLALELEIDDQPVAVSSPYLTVDPTDFDDVALRGRYDALAVRLRFSDRDLHDELSPTDVVARIVFDMLEQIRCEALVPDALPGVRNNIEHSFRTWCARETLSDTAFGLLVYTVLHMARSRLVHPIQNETIEDVLEATRANISPVIGVALKSLGESVGDQRAYAEHARAIGETIAEMVAGEVHAESGAPESVEAALLVPPHWGDDDDLNTDDAFIGTGDTSIDRVDQRSLDDVGGYHVFTREYDRETIGDTLYPEAVRRDLRLDLDEQIAAQSVSVYSLARRLKRLLAGVEADSWRVGEEEGVLDAHRLPQIVANPANRAVFRQIRYRPVAPAVVSFLVDNSGSMKRQRYEAMTVLVDTIARALDLAGASSEILGFTTRSWNGGESLREWRRVGEPEAPGRLAETDHIVYKDADTSWKRSRLGIAAMMKTQHYRESVDGEAIAWAYRRLRVRPEPRKLLVVLSDGAPMEAATMNANGETFLESHLRNVVHRIERERVVEIGAIAIDQPVDVFFSRSVAIDLTGTLTLSSYRVLERLFGHARR